MKTLYTEAFNATKKAMEKIGEFNGEEIAYSYKGYEDANAISLYVNNVLNINVLCTNAGNDGFKDAFNGLANREC